MKGTDQLMTLRKHGRAMVLASLLATAVSSVVFVGMASAGTLKVQEPGTTGSANDSHILGSCTSINATAVSGSTSQTVTFSVQSPTTALPGKPSTWSSKIMAGTTADFDLHDFLAGLTASSSGYHVK